jgi:hypothetical protein
MGSSGNGSFGDYKPSTTEDLCYREIKSVPLDEVSRSPYYQINNTVPPIMGEVHVLEELHNKRIAVESVEDGLIIGYLPTRFSYLLSCMKRGIRYVGNIDYSNDQPIPKVTVNLNAE